MDDELKKILEEKLRQHQDDLNRRPIADFDNLSAEDMRNLIHKPFEKECPIQYKKIISNSVLDNIPFLNLVEYFLNTINDAKTIKLTAKGNLPTKLVKELYALGIIKEELIELGISKLYKEEDSLSISNVKYMSMLSGLIKKKNGKLTLTKKGQKTIKSENRIELLKSLFHSYGYKFNLGFHDGYSDSNGVQTCLSYTLFQLLKNGSEEKSISYYSQKMLIAYPHVLMDFKDDTYSTPEDQFKSCYKVRIMERFINWFNLIEIRKENGKKSIFEDFYLKSNLINEVFEIRNENFKFKKGKYYA